MGFGHGGRRYVDIMFLNGGLGARPTLDGVSSIGWPANIAGTPVEVTENEKPLLFLTKELATDSGGAGRQRGGLAAQLAIKSEARDPITVGVRLDRIAHPALGLFGGMPGGTAAVSVNGKAVHAKKTIALATGDVFAVRCAGGAGYGDPHERAPSAVLGDVKAGYVSAAAARRLYGVALNLAASGIDEDATRALRQRT
jgi:N-methylhydantoinase B